MSDSTPDPGYYRDGYGQKPTWRLWIRHPLFAWRLSRRAPVRPGQGEETEQ